MEVGKLLMRYEVKYLISEIKNKKKTEFFNLGERILMSSSKNILGGKNLGRTVGLKK